MIHPHTIPQPKLPRKCRRRFVDLGNAHFEQSLTPFGNRRDSIERDSRSTRGADVGLTVSDENRIPSVR